MSTGFHRICITPIVEVVHDKKICLGGIEYSAASTNQHQHVVQEMNY